VVPAAQVRPLVRKYSAQLAIVECAERARGKHDAPPGPGQAVGGWLMMGDDESAQLRGGRGDKREPPPVVAAACPRRLGQRAGGAPGDAGEHRQGKHGARPDQRRPPGWAYWARSAITQEASTLARSALTRTAGTINASPPAATEACACRKCRPRL
jgi:hypothetical protein